MFDQFCWCLATFSAGAAFALTFTLWDVVWLAIKAVTASAASLFGIGTW